MSPYDGPKKKPKYGNRKTVVDGITFDSKREAKRYGELKLLLQAGLIRDLSIHKRYTLIVNGHKVCTYEADFDYFDVRKGEWVTEDAKGFRTREYLLKKKLLFALSGVKVVEV